MNNGIPYINIKYNRISNPIIIDGELPDPSSSTMGRTYMQPAQPSGQGNSYNEYITILKDGEYSWELIGLNIDLSALENKTNIASSDESTITAAFGNYYNVTGGTIINLPSIPSNQKYLQGFIVHVENTTGNPLVINPAQVGDNVYYMEGYDTTSVGTYEINFLCNGDSWFVTAVKFLEAV